MMYNDFGVCSEVIEVSSKFSHLTSSVLNWAGPKYRPAKHEARCMYWQNMIEEHWAPYTSKFLPWLNELTFRIFEKEKKTRSETKGLLSGPDIIFLEPKGCCLSR